MPHRPAPATIAVSLNSKRASQEPDDLAGRLCEFWADELIVDDFKPNDVKTSNCALGLCNQVIQISGKPTNYIG